jgi:hypothetical protein
VKRLGRVLLAVLVLASSAGVGELVAPRNAFACSCARIGRIADLAGQPGVVVVSGTISDVTNDRTGQHATFAVARVYHGLVPAAAMPIRGGGGGDCTVDLSHAVDVVMVARIADGMIVPGLCSPFADVSTPEGRQLLAEVNATFGAAVAPPAAAALSFDPVLVAILIVTPLVAMLLIVAIVVVLRRRDDRLETP